MRLPKTRCGFSFSCFELIFFFHVIVVAVVAAFDVLLFHSYNWTFVLHWFLSVLFEPECIIWDLSQHINALKSIQYSFSFFYFQLSHYTRLQQQILWLPCVSHRTHLENCTLCVSTSSTVQYWTTVTTTTNTISI